MADDTVGKLVDLSDEDSKDVINVNISDASEPSLDLHHLEQSSPENSEAQKTDKHNISLKRRYTRLCGYLNKQASRGIIKVYRRRWFVFSENNCKLYYYNSPRDQDPLGEIDVSQASFMFDATSKEKAGMFTISVPGKVYNLQAKNHQTCLFWLQELQKFRRAHSLRRTELMSSGVFSSYNDLFGEPQSGLLGKRTSKTSFDDEIFGDSELMPSVEIPDDAIGDKCSLASTASPVMTPERKFPDLCSLTQGTVNSVWHDVTPEGSGLNSHENEMDQSRKTGSSNAVPHTFLGENSLLNLPNECDYTTMPSQTKATRNPGLQAFRLKISASFRKSRLSRDNYQVSSSIKTQSEVTCSKCRQTERKLKSTLEASALLEEELKVAKEVMSGFRKQLEITVKERETLAELNQMTNTQRHLELLSVKDHQLINLSHDCEDLKQEIESLQKHIISLKKEITDLQQQNEVFQELLKEKDRIIINLTNEVFDFETEKKDQELNQKSCSSVEVPRISEGVNNSDDQEKLKDSLQAFELQNKFLNKEILELNQLRDDAENCVNIITVKCSEWEARSYQIQSKLLFLLNELNKPELINQNRDIINRLLQEAVYDDTSQGDLNPENRNLISWSRNNMYDELGFNWKWGKDDLLYTKAENLKERSANLSNRSKDADFVSWHAKWDNFIVALGTKELQHSTELKTLIRHGIPHEYKGRIWKGCVEMRVSHLKTRLGSNYYSLLLSESKYSSVLDPASKQIELDLLRTLPNNRHYETLDSDGIPQLRRVLLAYSRHDPSVGYCQGLNRLAAIALLFLEEEDAFWCLVAIIKYIMPEDYYSRTLLASQADQGVLKDFISEKLPRLYTHLESSKVDLSLFTFNWFLTIFVDNIAVEVYLRIWDAFLYEGCKILFRYALAIFKICENEILQIGDYISINRFLRNMTENLKDSKRISHIAFNEIRQFRMKDINSKRSHHMRIVKAQLEELEKIRQSFPKSEQRHASAEYNSEDDQ